MKTFIMVREITRYVEAEDVKEAYKKFDETEETSNIVFLKEVRANA